MTDDYCARGKIAIPGTWDTIPNINNLIRTFDWERIIKVKDVLKENDRRFIENYKGDPDHDLKPEFTILSTPRIWLDPKTSDRYWIKHSIEGTVGTNFDMLIKKVYLKDVEIIKHGSDVEVSHSAFGTVINPTNMEAGLKAQGIKNIVFCGAALDFGVGYSAIDAKSKGYGS